MREKQRRLERKRLDEEMRPFRRAAAKKGGTNELLRAVRQALNIPMKEVVEKMGVSPSAVYELELSEARRTISLSSMARMAQAMGCKVVYGVVPVGGKTLEKLAEERYWREVLRD